MSLALSYKISACCLVNFSCRPRFADNLALNYPFSVYSAAIKLFKELTSSANWASLEVWQVYLQCSSRIRCCNYRDYDDSLPFLSISVPYNMRVSTYCSILAILCCRQSFSEVCLAALEEISCYSPSIFYRSTFILQRPFNLQRRSSWIYILSTCESEPSCCVDPQVTSGWFWTVEETACPFKLVLVVSMLVILNRMVLISLLNTSLCLTNYGKQLQMLFCLSLWGRTGAPLKVIGCITMSKDSNDKKVIINTSIIVYSFSMEQDLFKAITRNDSVSVRSISISMKSSLSQILDDKHSTVLHVCCNNNNYDLVEYFLKEFESRASKHEEFYTAQDKKTWLNRKDKDGFTCLHYAVFKGSFKITRLLEDHGADIYEINALGLCVMHIAAQGDSPLLLFYFLNKGFRIQVEDSKGSSPLHWACYSGRENAVNALLAWGAQMNIQDKSYGLTPLHLAVLSANGRIVKKLLIKGANRTIRDFRSKLALDLAKQNEYTTIASMIEDRFGIDELYNLKQPYRKTSTKCSIPFGIFMFLYLSTFLLNLVFVVRKADKIQNVLYIIFSILPIFFLLAAGCINPGYLKTKIEPAQQFDILLKYAPDKICFDCQIVRPMRSRHCEVCSSCVMVYDHHCPWINNCVGARNYLMFYIFILTMEIDLVMTLIYSIYSLAYKIDYQDTSALSVLHICSSIYSIVNTVFVLPLTLLIIIQSRNCLTNITTFQKYSSKKETPDRTSSSIMLQRTSSSYNTPVATNSGQFQELGVKEPFVEYVGIDGPSTRNCMSMCFSNQKNLVYKIGS